MTRIALVRIVSKTKQYIKAMSKVCDGLRGDAFVAAQEVGFDNLCEIIDGRPCGIDTLINRMRGIVFPLTERESKESFRQNFRPGGPLSRQDGESMKQHVSRRRRCWTLLVQMDPVIHLSDGHRSDMLLDLSGLTREKRVMVQASIGNERDFDRVADALIIQHPRIHLRERVKDERRAKAKTDSKVLTLQTLVGFAEKVKVNTPAAENPERVPVTRTSLPLKITIIMRKTWMNLQTPIKPTMTQLTPGAITEKKLWTTTMIGKTTRCLRMLPWMMLLFSRQLNWMQLLFLPTHGTTILTLK